jgi:photosynthetic reaction center cytochrome c subunit
MNAPAMLASMSIPMFMNGPRSMKKKFYLRNLLTSKLAPAALPIAIFVFRRMAILLAAFVLVAYPAALRAQQPKVKDMQGKTAGEFFKNVKVLKDLPATELHPAMEYITVALGVGCPYCHDVRKFDSDDNVFKRSARNMIQMMYAIDDTAFAGKREVTCYTCHRGAPIGADAQLLPGQKPPAQVPSPDSYGNVVVPNLTLDSSMGPARPERPEGGGERKPASAALPSADDLLSKYQQAVGGSAAVQSAVTLVEKGTVEMLMPNPPGVQGPLKMGNPAVEVYRKAPNRAAEFIQLPAGQAMQGYDGSSGWLVGPVNRELMGGELFTVQDWSEFVPAWNFKKDHTNIRVLPMDKIDGHDVYVVIGVAKNGSGVDRLYFDMQTGLLIRAVTNMNSVLGSFPETTDFDDYRDVSGLKVAATVHLLSPEGDRTYKFDQIEANTPVEDAKFQQPAPQPPGPAGGAPPAASPASGGPAR